FDGFVVREKVPQDLRAVGIAGHGQRLLGEMGSEQPSEALDTSSIADLPRQRNKIFILLRSGGSKKKNLLNRLVLASQQNPGFVSFVGQGVILLPDAKTLLSPMISDLITQRCKRQLPFDVLPRRRWLFRP